MCSDHSGTLVSVRSGDGWTRAGVDSCIADLVRVLNIGGFRTVASCCGHGRQPGRISLADGGELLIAPDYESAQRVERAFPPIHDSPGHPQNDLAPIGASSGT